MPAAAINPFLVTTRTFAVNHLAAEGHHRYALCGRDLKWTAAECRVLGDNGKKLCARCSSLHDRSVAEAKMPATMPRPTVRIVPLPKTTPMERDVLGGIYRSDYTDGCGRPDIWSWSIAARITTQAQLGGVVGSLARKGLVSCYGAGKEAVISVTERGEAVAKRDGLRPEGWRD